MNSTIRIRLRIIVYVIFVFLVALLLRLYFLQVISGELYAEMASESIARQQSIAAPRGNIYDRNGKLLVRSIPVAAVAVEPYKLLSDDKAIELLPGIGVPRGHNMTYGIRHCFVLKRYWLVCFCEGSLLVCISGE